MILYEPQSISGGHRKELRLELDQHKQSLLLKLLTTLVNIILTLVCHMKAHIKF